MPLYMKLYCTQAEKEGGLPSSEVIPCALLRALRSPRPDVQPARQQPGQSGERRVFSEGGRPPAGLSVSPAHLAHTRRALRAFLLPLRGAPVLPVTFDCSAWYLNSNHGPILTAPFVLLLGGAWCLPLEKRSVGHTGYFLLAPGNFGFFLCIISRMLQPFVHGLVAWSVVRGRTSFDLKQH